MTTEHNKNWARISSKLNFSPSGSYNTQKYIENNLDAIKGLKAEDINDVDVQPSSLILRLAKHSPKLLGQVLDGWQESGELNEILYRVAGEGNPQTIANTLSGLSKAPKKDHLNGFYDALKNCGRLDDFVANANEEELKNSTKALSILNREDAKLTVRAITDQKNKLMQTTVAPPSKDSDNNRHFQNMVEDSKQDLCIIL